MAFPESFEDRLGIVFERTLPKLGPEARAQLQAIIEPQSLAIIAGVLVAWVVSHAFGVGEIIDIVLLVAGVLAKAGSLLARGIVFGITYSLWFTPDAGTAN